MSRPADAGLKVTLPTDRDIVMTRTFEAPRRLVFDAWTRPEHLVHWYGREGWTLTTCQIDLRPGGAWRYVMHGPDGAEMGMRGVFREVVPPEHLVTTETFDGAEGEAMGGGSVNTVTFDERGGRTTVTITAHYRSRAARDAVLETAMAEGLTSALNRLAGHLAARG